VTVQQIFGAAIALAAVCSPTVSSAQTETPPPDPLINLDAPGVLNKGAVDGRVDVRAFGGDEGLVYTSLGAGVGFGKGWEGVLRGAFAGRKTLALPGGGGIRHGGSDIELQAKYAPQSTFNIASHPVSVAGLIGVSFPSTPAIGDTHLTLGLSAGASIGNGSAVYVNPRAVLIADNTIFGLGLGARVRLKDQLALIGDYTPILSGSNTRDTTTGATKSRDVYGVAVRYLSTNDRYALDLGYTNGAGSTTGFALTPGLDGSGAFYIALTARR
jgi:hypothetical protein